MNGGGWPLSSARMASAAARPTRRTASEVWPATWGERMTLGSERSGEFWRERLAGVGVERGAGEAAGEQRGEQRWLVDEFAAGRVDEDGAEPHGGEGLGADRSLGLPGQPAVQGDDVGSGQELGEREQRHWHGRLRSMG